ATGLLSCARNVYGALPNGFYGLDTVLLEAVLRALTGQARAEGATRIDPASFGRVLGLDRAPEVKTIRRKLALLAATGKTDRLIAAMAATHLARATGRDEQAGLLLYVDGHVRAYHGTRKVGKTHLARLKFPAPATLETWVNDAHGDPVLVVMAEPGASLAGELRRLVPDLRAAVGDDRRVLVGFDRGGWSPALFKHLHGHGFDSLTWRKGAAEVIPAKAFRELTYRDPDTGQEYAWRAADTTVDLPLGTKPGPDGAEPVFTMRQVTLAVPVTKHARTTPDTPADDTPEAGTTGAGTPADDTPGAGTTGDDGVVDLAGTRQIHILTTRTDLPAEEIIYRMGARWRQENHFRYGRMHFDLDSHDCYASADDDPGRSVPNPAKKRAHAKVTAARARVEQAAAATDAALLAARTPVPGAPVTITNREHDQLTADLRAAQAALTLAEAAHKDTPARLPLRLVNPGQQVLDVQTKLVNHAIRMAAFNTVTTLARELRLHTGYARKKHEAHTLIRQALRATGDIDPTTDGVLTIRLDPLPTRRASTAIAELCQHLTATNTRYPGTDLIMRYEIKTAL
ncbi:MAG: hypothetical protein L0H64_23450, partial [Pseudonocardia sp.]|nr:hypothetical protein [Pseudonocardia sp.]